MLILTIEQAQQVSGEYTPNKGLDPRENPDNPGEFWLTDDVLENANVPKWIKDILITCPQKDINPPVDELN